MGFKQILEGTFLAVYTEVEFVKRSYGALKAHGFNDENAIAALCVCRDEISQGMRSIVKHIWGEAFDLSSLAGMFFAGKTGLKAAMHHAPVEGGKERYVFYSLPHIAIDSDGAMGICRREGRPEASTACGALRAFQMELETGKLNISMDNSDVEQSLMRMRLAREIPYGRVPDLLELTKTARAAIQTDIEDALRQVVDARKSDYALFSGIQVHGPDGNYIWPASGYAVVDGKRKEISL